MGSGARSWEAILPRGVAATDRRGFWRFLALLKSRECIPRNCVPASAGGKVPVTPAALSLLLRVDPGRGDAAPPEPPVLLGNLQHVQDGPCERVGAGAWLLPALILIDKQRYAPARRQRRPSGEGRVTLYENVRAKGLGCFSRGL